MILGHYAAAYIALPHNRAAPFWLLLVSANLPEFLWLVLALLGVEPTEPASLLDATFQNLQVQMTYSHNVLPNVLLALVTFGAVFIWFRNLKLAAWCAGLTVLHVWCDYLVGFKHEWLGADSPSIGLNSYYRFPHLAIVMELVFSWLCLGYYAFKEKGQGRPVSRQRLFWLFLAFTVGVAAWLPNATIPMRQLFGL